MSADFFLPFQTVFYFVLHEHRKYDKGSEKNDQDKSNDEDQNITRHNSKSNKLSQ